MVTSTATKSAKSTAKSKVKSKTLSQILPYEEKVRLMYREVLREEVGRELANQARFNDISFDWQDFNERFREEYADYSTEKFAALLRKYYGLQDVEAIRTRRREHKRQRQERMMTER